MMNVWPFQKKPLKNWKNLQTMATSGLNGELPGHAGNWENMMKQLTTLRTSINSKRSGISNGKLPKITSLKVKRTSLLNMPFQPR